MATKKTKSKTATKMTDVFFIVDGNRLEAQACLLAPSLKRHLTASQRAIAYVRQDYMDAILPFTRDVLNTCGVEIREIPDTDAGHAPWSEPYPQGNKILAACAPRDSNVSVFLDTDMIMAEPINFAQALGKAEIGAVVSDYQAYGGDEDGWAEFYGHYGLDLPTERVKLTGGRQLMSLPYYKGGLIVFRVHDTKGKPLGIAQDWLDVALTFEAEVKRDYLRANIDQLTLPILGYWRDKPVIALEQRLNFNIEAFGQGEGQRQSIAHYHRLGILWKHQVHARAALDGLIEATDASGPDQFLEHFGEHAKRKRMKHHLHAMAA
jgi:hypothetical protein